jgi:chromosome segregation protein
MLKRLELVGFKSFNQKTTLDFPKGITVIVGPNGSGKSNIIDALRWLLGERESKNLRGGKAEDLIFSGTSKKTRLGMAQASIYLDNKNKIIPLDFIDLVVTRRIHRDGNSDYLVNKSAVRLKDIVTLFAQSKLGTKGLTIINQGNNELFVKASPKERREMMEEILGLKQYQLKKHDAQLKLSNTQNNLEKVGTTLEELVPRLRLLRRQAKKWEKRAVYETELKNLENSYFTLKIKDLEQANRDIDPSIKAVDQQLKDKLVELKQLEQAVKKIENQKPLPPQQTDQRFALQKEIAQLEAQIQYAPPRSKTALSSAESLQLIKQVRERITQLITLADLIKIRSALADLGAVIDQSLAGETEEEVQLDNQAIKMQLASLKNELKNINQIEKNTHSQFSDFNNLFRQAFEATANKRQEIQQLEIKKNQLILVKDRGHLRWQNLEDQMAQVGKQKSDFDNVQLVADFDSLQAEKRMIRLRNDLAMIGEIDQELVQEAQEEEERYQFLSTQSEELKKATIDLDQLIQDLTIKVHNDFKSSLKLANQEFNKYFKQLFREGKAQLISTDEGIDISLNIPSKGIKSLSSLSGGEKSLVAIAVLFALTSISPPPFLILDEVDAALDEKNSQRFAELLKTLGDKTQFVIVTHNRSVMESADVLYGVTMGDDGISKILSLKLS